MNARDDQKARTRERILESATRLFKRRGIAGASVVDIMSDAGLTVGGFYAHFDSKESLVNEALYGALQARRARLARSSDSDWRVRIGAMLDGYLTREHRDDPVNGCPVPSVVGDVARDGTGRPAFAEEFAALARTLAATQTASEVRTTQLAGEKVGECARDDAQQAALGALALMAGGIVLARALSGTPLSDDVLAAARAFGHAALGARPADGGGD